AGGALPRERQGLERAEAQTVIRAPGGNQGACVACEPERHGWAVAPRAPRGAPGVDGRGGVRERAVCPWGGPGRRGAPLMGGLGPRRPKHKPQGGGGTWVYGVVSEGG